MFRLWCANDLGRLVEELSSAIGREREASGLGFFQRADVVVPNPFLGQWLELEVARRSAIAANFAFPLLQGYVSGLIPSTPDFADIRLASRPVLQKAILDLFHDQDFLRAAELESVRGYIDAVGSEDARDLRRYQLASHLGGLFDEYAFSRPELLAAWSADTSHFDESEVEVWQRYVWRALFDEDQIFEAGGFRHVTLSSLLEVVPVEALEVGTDRALHLFGLPSLGPVFQQLLETLSSRVDIEAYLLAPCKESWSSMLTGRDDEAGVETPAPSEGWTPEAEQPLLRLWGRVGRDTLHMFESLARDEVTRLAPASPPQPESLLSTLKADILNRRAENVERAGAKADESLQLIETTGVRREMEIVANEIWRRVKSDESLGFEDFAILIPDGQQEAYVPRLEAAFQSFGELPYRLVGLPFGTDDRIVEAAELLLELPLGSYKRGELLRLMVHPNVCGRFAEVETETWLRWCDELNILHGADRHDYDGTYIKRDVFNWDQGLRRLVLGICLDCDGNEHIDRRRLFELGDDLYIPEHVSTSDAPLASQLILLARSLIADSQWLKAQRLSLARWAEIFDELLKTYIVPQADDNWAFEQESSTLQRCRGALRQLAEIDLSRQEVSYRTALQFARYELTQLTQSGGHSFVGGVVVGSPRALRGIPFRHIHVVGLDEEHFPAREDQDPLDLRHLSWRRGDVWPADRDRFAFLETLIAARESLSLSWVSREATTGEALQASSAVSELVDTVALFDVKREDYTQVHPLRRFARHCGYFPELPVETCGPLEPSLDDEARAEATLRALHDNLSGFCKGRNLPLPGWPEMREQVLSRGNSAAALRELLRLPMLDDSPKEPTTEPGLRIEVAPNEAQAPMGEPRTVRLSLSRLRNFLESPLQAAAKTRLGLREDDDDALDAEVEGFDTNRMYTSIFLREVFHEALLSPLASADLEALYDRRLLPWFELLGRLPTGHFLEKQRREHLRQLSIWNDFIEFFPKKGVAFSPEEPVQFFGIGVDGGRVTDKLPPLVFDLVSQQAHGSGEPLRVELYGITEAVFLDGHATMSLSGSSGHSLKGFMRGYLSHLALAASGIAPEGGRRGCLVYQQTFSKGPRGGPQKSTFTRELSAVDPSEAHNFLHALIADLFSNSNDYLFPVEAVEKLAKARGKRPFDFSKYLAGELENEGSVLSCKFGPLKTFARYGAPDDPEALFDKRFHYFKKYAPGA